LNVVDVSIKKQIWVILL